MATLFVLYVDDEIVAPCLDLIRKVCEPESRSVPHITIRYVESLNKNNLDIYNQARIKSVNFLSVGSFGIDEDESQKNGTVYIKCASDVLERLSHKPRFPDSVFHITLYDGNSKIFARKLLKIIDSIKWDFILELFPQRSLTRIDIDKNKKKSKKSKKPMSFSSDVEKLYKKITNRNISQDELESLSEGERLEITEKVCLYLELKASGFRKVRRKILDGLTPSESNGRAISPSIDTKIIDRLDNRQTNKDGLYLTPPELAHEIVEYVKILVGPNNKKIKFGDPSIGTGVLFSSLIHSIPANHIESAIGIELNAKRAQDTIDRWGHKGLEVIRGDYLHMEELPPRSLILANPPYVRYQHINKEYKERLREKASLNMGAYINGQSGLYIYFILLSHSWMEKNATAAWLIPSEFMDSNYGSVLRDYLTSKVNLVRIHRFDSTDMQFDNALVASSVIFFENKEPAKNHNIMMSSGGSLLNPTHNIKAGLDELRRLSRWVLKDDKLVIPSVSGAKIGDLFNIKRGIATGANDFFILDKDELHSLGIPMSLVKPIVPKSRFLDGNVICSDPDGFPDTPKKQCVLNIDLPEEEILREYPRLMEYLDSDEGHQIRERTLVKGRKPWYKQEQREVSPFICTYMGRGGRKHSPIRFMLNESNAITTNVYLMMYPSEKLQSVFENDPKKKNEILELLNETAEFGLDYYLKNYGGGLRKMEPKDLLQARLVHTPDWIESITTKELF